MGKLSNFFQVENLDKVGDGLKILGRDEGFNTMAGFVPILGTIATINEYATQAADNRDSKKEKKENLNRPENFDEYGNMYTDKINDQLGDWNKKPDGKPNGNPSRPDGKPNGNPSRPDGRPNGPKQGKQYFSSNGMYTRPDGKPNGPNGNVPGTYEIIFQPDRVYRKGRMGPSNTVYEKRPVNGQRQTQAGYASDCSNGSCKSVGSKRSVAFASGGVQTRSGSK